MAALTITGNDLIVILLVILLIVLLFRLLR